VRSARRACAREAIDERAGVRVDGRPLAEALRRPEFSCADLRAALVAAAERSAPAQAAASLDDATLERARIEAFYEPYARKGRAQAARMAELERRSLPATLDYARLPSLRTEARQALMRFRPATLGQASRLEGLTPADVTLLAVLVKKERERAGR
jgi:tRNA uridine 5-carboxymethylaminomethyl modification enzyme